MRTFRRGSVLAGILILFTVSAFGLDVGNEHAQAAFAAGDKETLVGAIEIDGSTISITTSSGTYAIRMGNRPFSSALGFELVEGAEIAVFGFVYDAEVIPIVVVSEGSAYFLRDTDGTPLWATPRFGPAV